ncbi:MAG: guanylate kinase [Legionellaceae bacterium]|nr:guanylate kinase [Legionellaceae bacterium]
MTNNAPGCLYIVASPSGGGKTSLVKELVAKVNHIETSTSHTTRKIRPAEKNGVDYFFISDQEFSKMIKNGDFTEHANVYGHFYGTSIAQINTRLQDGIDIVLDIDWQGAQQIKKLYPDSVSIFVVPPSLEILEERLTKRAQDNKDIINNRMQQAKDEMSHYNEFDYLIINDEFSIAVQELISIVKSERQKMFRQVKRHGKLLSFLITSQ